MKLAVIGTGYVGLVTGACLADVGNDVLCIDVDRAKIERLRAGEVPIHEPGLDAVVERSVKAGRLRFSTSYDEAVAIHEKLAAADGMVFAPAALSPPGYIEPKQSPCR